VALALAPAAAAPRRTAAPPARDEQVKIEVRFISMAEDFFERIGVDFSSDGAKDKASGPADPREPSFLDENQTRKFLQAAEGDVRTNITQIPSILVSNGKTAVVRCLEKRPLANPVRQTEPIAYCPKSETLSTGYELSVRPKITSDRRAVTLDLKTALNSLNSEELPRTTTLSLESKLTIPAGGTVLLGGWKRLSEGRREYGPPALSKVPYVNRLFRNVGYTKATENVLVMVTASIVRDETRATSHREKEIAPCASWTPGDSREPAQAKKVAKLMKQYHQACSAGQLDKARKFARQALALDPACFDKQPMLKEVGSCPCSDR
jgi:type II secretory pathway component GspD/PulD (secretin)